MTIGEATRTAPLAQGPLPRLPNLHHQHSHHQERRRFLAEETMKRPKIRLAARGLARLAFAGATVMLAACQTTATDRKTVGAPDQVDSALSQSADRVSSAMRHMAEIETARKVVENAPIDQSLVPPEMSKEIDIAWSGPLDQAVEHLALTMGWSFGIIGKKPAVPVIVTMSAKGRPIVEIMQTFAAQAIGAAKINVDAGGRRLEVEYVGR